MSSAQITDDVVGKHVVTGDGEEVGIVSSVEYGTAYVDPDPDLTTKIKTALGWEDDPDAAGYPLQEAAISTIDDDTVRLRSDL